MIKTNHEKKKKKILIENTVILYFIIYFHWYTIDSVSCSSFYSIRFGLDNNMYWYKMYTINNLKLKFTNALSIINCI